MFNKLWFNIFAGIVDIIISILGVFTLYFANEFFLNQLSHNIKILCFQFTTIKLIFFLLSIISWILHMVGFVEAYNNNVYNVGNILGIIASGVIILKLGKIKLFTIIVYFIAASFSLIQKRLYL